VAEPGLSATLPAGGARLIPERPELRPGRPAAFRIGARSEAQGAALVS